MLPRCRGKRVAVVGHARPDGDCIGSQVAVARVLRALGSEVVCVNMDAVPRRLQFLVHDLEFKKALEVEGDDWLAVFVDCADHGRAGDKARARFPKPFGNIDHHLSNIGYAENNFVDVAAAATCEILAGMFFDAKLPVDKMTAQALFAGIMTDTGQFRFNSTTRRTFMLAAELVALGANPAEIGGEIYERESAGKLQLLQRFLASLKLECGGVVCIGTLPNGIFEETGSNPEDTEGLVDYARAIDGVEIGVLIEERAGAIKASLRSKEPRFRVDQVAARFNGGGHACAAGLNLKNITMAEFRAQLLVALEEQLAAVKRK
ncbi:DHH family phosphoesterase [Opitutaceae bacterium EW11]|nr:DHH family phosphoesterase [Opitutaceae bacterium EW11]